MSMKKPKALSSKHSSATFRGMAFNASKHYQIYSYDVWRGNLFVNRYDIFFKKEGTDGK